MNPFKWFANTLSNVFSLEYEETREENQQISSGESESIAPTGVIISNKLLQNQQITSNLEARALPDVRAALASTCRFFGESFKARLTVEKLKGFVNWGEEENAREELEKDPMLLLKTQGVASDVFARPGLEKRNITPFKIALCNYDVEMAVMMKEFFERLPDGFEKMQEQFDEIFPNGIDARIVKQKASAFDFTEIIEEILNTPKEDVQAALNKEDNDSDLCVALKKMRTDLIRVTSHELIANPFHLQNAFDAYNTTFDKLTDKQQDLFCIQVIGFAQSRLSAYILQLFAQGRYDIVKKGESFSRSFNFASGVGSLVVNSGRGLGFDYWLGGAYVMAVPRRWGARGGVFGDWGGSGGLFRDLCQTKISGLENLCCPV